VGIFSSPPKINVRVPHPMFLGHEIVVGIDVLAVEETPVEYVVARVSGIQGWSVGSGKSRVARRETYPDLAFRIGEAGTLPAGTTSFPLVFALPPDVPPTHEIDPAYAFVELRVRVAIPWRWDARGRFTLAVRAPSAPFPVPRTPMIAMSRTGGAAGEPRIELGLSSTRLIVGETLVGSCAVFHLPDDEPRPVEVMLVPGFVLKGAWRDREREGQAHGAYVTIPAGAAGRAVPFHLPIPALVPPTFDALTHRLSWELVARTRTGGFFGGNLVVRIPIELVDATAAAVSAPLAFAPSVADELVAGVFARFAARGWRIGGRDEDDDAGDGDPRGPAVERDAGASVVRIAYRYRGEQGTFLVSKVDHPPLGLRLEVVPGSVLRHMFFADFESGTLAFDRAHRASARSHDQARPLLAAIAPALVRCTDVGRLVRWNDDAMTFERAITGVDEGVLEAVAAELEQLARTLDPLIAAIEPPVGLVVDRDAWRALAGWLEGTLSIGDLSVDGRLGGLPVAIGLVWDDDTHPVGVRAFVGSTASASAALRELSFALPQPGPDALGHPTAERLVPLLAAWPTDLVDLRIAGGTASATWRLADDRVGDAARVRGLVEALRAVLAALEPSAGPYR
jgi:hypothetical protein